MLSQELVGELKTILEDDFGVKADFKMASECAESFVSYFDTLARAGCLQEHKGTMGKYEYKTDQKQ